MKRHGWHLAPLGGAAVTVAVLSAPAFAASTPAGASPIACVGDCGGDGEVTVDELLTMVNVALGSLPVSACPNGDADGSGDIAVNEIVAAVNNALNACPGAVPTPTPSPTPITHTVVVGPGEDLVFSPSELSIHVGDTVQWSWASSGHNVVGGSADCTPDGRFCSPSDSSCDFAPLSPSDTTYSHTFTAAGTFPYFCSAHCGLGMVGTITVQ